jgi:hypothetical protein
MKRLKFIQDKLISLVQSQDFECANAQEMGEVIDMIKDIDQTLYYHSIVKAMEGADAASPMVIYEEEPCLVMDTKTHINKIANEIMEVNKKASADEKLMLKQKLISLTQQME